MELKLYGNHDPIERTLPICRDNYDQKGSPPMLWTIFVILLVLWLVGFIGFHVLGAYIHILLLIALVVLILQLINGRRTI